MKEQTRIQTLIQNLSLAAYYKIEVKDLNGTALTTDRNLGTASTVKVTNQSGQEIASYKVVVKGDITGEGIVNLYDIVRIVKYVYDPEPGFTWDESIRRAGRVTATEGIPRLFDIQRIISYCFNEAIW